MARLLPIIAALVLAGCGAVHGKPADDPTAQAPGSIVFAGEVEEGGTFHRGYFAVAPDGKDLRQLAYPEEVFSELSFSANRDLVALSIMRGDRFEVLLSRPDVWKPRKILPTDTGSDASLSPDGKNLAVAYQSKGSDHEDVWIASTDGRDLRQVTFTGSAANTAWSPDGAWIAFTDDHEARSSDAEIVYLVRADGTGLHRIPGEYISLSRPAWSPDGARLALEDLDGRIVVVDVDGKSKTVLTSGEAPAWSPDGKWIAFTRNVPADEEGIWENALLVIPANGGRAERILTVDDEYGPMSWTTARPARKPS